MLKFKILFLFILTSCLSYGQLFNAGTTQKNFYTEINYEWVNGKIIIPVEIEGKTYRFLLDTGAPNIISQNLLKTISTDFKQAILITDSNNKKDSLDMVTIPLMKIGGVSYSNIPSLVNKDDTNPVFECFELDGFIGSNLLRKSIIQISHKDQLIKLTDNKKRLTLNRKHSSKIKFKDRQSSPYIWIKLESNKKAKEQILIDTGMFGFYDLSKTHLSIFQDDDILKIRAEGEGSAGIGIFDSDNASKQYKLVIPKIKINNTTFKDINVVTTNGSDSRIGSKILNYGDITIDYINKRFYYETFETVVDLKEKTYGFNPTMINKKLVIGLVWDDDLKSEIKYGDQIIEANNIDFTNYNYCNLITKESIFRNSDHVNMTILGSNGIKKNLTVNKK